MGIEIEMATDKHNEIVSPQGTVNINPVCTICRFQWNEHILNANDLEPIICKTFPSFKIKIINARLVSNGNYINSPLKKCIEIVISEEEKVIILPSEIHCIFENHTLINNKLGNKLKNTIKILNQISTLPQANFFKVDSFFNLKLDYERGPDNEGSIGISDYLRLPENLNIDDSLDFIDFVYRYKLKDVETDTYCSITINTDAFDLEAKQKENNFLTINLSVETSNTRSTFFINDFDFIDEKISNYTLSIPKLLKGVLTDKCLLR